MANVKLLLAKIPILVVFTLAFHITNLGEEGQLQNDFLRQSVFPKLRSVTGITTNVKFLTRGPEKPKNKIVIVEIDSASLEQLGRWPWHRDLTAYLIEKTFEAGAKVVGLDIVFSEPDRRIPEELGKALAEKNIPDLNLESFETDPLMAGVIEKYRDKLVLGWATEAACQPGYSGLDECPVTHPEAIATLPEGFEKFAYKYFEAPVGFNFQTTPVFSIPLMIPNIKEFNQPALHAGTFNVFPDPDGYVRRTPLTYLINGRAHPTLAMEVARAAMGEDLKAILDDSGRIRYIGFANSGKQVPVSPLGVMDINFRGPAFSFDYVSALEVLGDSDEIHIGATRSIAASKAAVLKDAIVLIGLTAIGVHDMRAFPFDSNTSGVEGHANIVDNLMAGDWLVSNTSGGGTGSLVMFLLMTVGALLFAHFTGKLEAVPGLLLFIVTLGGFWGIDQKLFFEGQNINWNSGFFYLEILTVYFFAVAAKYVMEERNKKFVKGAFAKYVSPAVVDSIMKDPAKLTVGGEKKEITIMFSDIRSFTTFSEKMDAKDLSIFLNDYLGLMTGTVFEFAGTLDKYIGDAVMAFWGAPLDLPLHGQNACDATIKMMRIVTENRPRWKEKYGVDVAIGIGLNTGHVSVGNMGSTQNFSYTVIGDSVNLASRIEGLTKYYGAGILTTRFTFDSILANSGKIPPHRVLDFVKVKGKNKAVELIEILFRDYKSEGLTRFQEARELYSQKKFDEAIQAFKEASEILCPPGEDADGPSAMYIERCEYFKANPPEADWDGSWKMETK